MLIEMREMPVWGKNDPTGARILDAIDRIILDYGVCTVSDLYGMIAIFEPSYELSDSYIENKYGWIECDIPGFKIKYVLGGYTIMFNEPRLLD